MFSSVSKKAVIVELEIQETTHRDIHTMHNIHVHTFTRTFIDTHTTLKDRFRLFYAKSHTQMHTQIQMTHTHTQIKM